MAYLLKMHPSLLFFSYKYFSISVTYEQKHFSVLEPYEQAITDQVQNLSVLEVDDYAPQKVVVFGNPQFSNVKTISIVYLKTGTGSEVSGTGSVVL